jgi:hypothetical protein
MLPGGNIAFIPQVPPLKKGDFPDHSHTIFFFKGGKESPRSGLLTSPDPIFCKGLIEKLWERCYGKFTFSVLPNWEILINPSSIPTHCI